MTLRHVRRDTERQKSYDRPIKVSLSNATHFNVAANAKSQVISWRFFYGSGFASMASIHIYLSEIDTWLDL